MARVVRVCEGLLDAGNGRAWRLSCGPERRCPFWLWHVWARWAWDLCLYLFCPRPDLMGADPERRRWHGQE